MPETIRTNLDLKAPPGKFRVVGVDVFSSAGHDLDEWLEGDFTTLNEAILRANAEVEITDDNPSGRNGLMFYVYDDRGSPIYRIGEYVLEGRHGIVR